MIILSPSILSADFSKLGEDVEALEKYGADAVHIDIMDGHFVPNISFGPSVMKSIRNRTSLMFDVHLMISEPSKYIDEFIDAGADLITIHYESDIHIDRTINYIKSKGVKAGIALNPGTDVSLIKHLIKGLDLVLIMSVNPGFGGQSFIPYSLDKIREVKALSEKYNKELLIQVDGGANEDNIATLVDAGANMIVAGSAVFKDGKIKENIEVLKGKF